MWFDPYAALSGRKHDGGGQPPASSASSANPASRLTLESPRLAEIAGLAAPRASDPETLAVALDSFEERAAIREFEGRQAQADAERAALAETAAAFGVAPETWARYARHGEAAR